MTLHKGLPSSPLTSLRDFLQARSDPMLAESMLRVGAAAITHYQYSSVTARAEALHAAFPTVALLLGAEGFGAMATSFSRSMPARHWDLNAYGDELPQWISAQQPDADGAQLAEVARLDWAMHRAAFAADAPPLDRVALAAVDGSLQAQLRLQAHPATALLVSNQPVASLWRAARDETLAVPAEPETALVGRDAELRVWMRSVSAGEAAFITAMQAGQGLGDALAAGLSAEPDFDLGGRLSSQIDDQVWCGFEILPL